MRKILQVLLSSIYFSQLVRTKQVSQFGQLDLNGVCVHGTVEFLENSHHDGCFDNRCQVAVSILNVYMRQLNSQNYLAITIDPEGQTLHTLSSVYFTVIYPDESKSYFIASIWNLNGYHKRLLNSIQFQIPLDRHQDLLGNETISVEVRSKCSCSNFRSVREINPENLVELDSAYVEEPCYMVQKNYLAEHFSLQIYLAVLILVACYTIAALMLMRKMVERPKQFEIKEDGTLKVKQPSVV